MSVDSIAELKRLNKPENLTELRKAAIHKREYWLGKRKKVLSEMAGEEVPTPEQWSKLAETSTALSLIGFFLMWIDSIKAGVRARIEELEGLGELIRSKELKRILEGEAVERSETPERSEGEGRR